MKKISEEQVKQILQTMMELNIPVKVYAGLSDLFAKLPICKKDEAKKE